MHPRTLEGGGVGVAGFRSPRVIGFQSSCGSVMNLTPALELGMAAGQPLPGNSQLVGAAGSFGGCSELICKRTQSSLDRGGWCRHSDINACILLEASGRGHFSAQLFQSFPSWVRLLSALQKPLLYRRYTPSLQGPRASGPSLIKNTTQILF